MDLSWERNKAIVSNIANAETPQYRAQDVNFAGALAQAFRANEKILAKTSAKHMDLASNDGQPRLEQDLSGMTKPDGNNVDLDIQMGKLAFNSSRFSMATNLIRKQLTVYKNAIRDSSR
jgi:flagellar basal-body rod protein FlgB